MKPTTRMLVALTLLASGIGRAQAGYITATLTANPSTIDEGGSTGLTLSVQDTPYYNYGGPYYFPGYGNYYAGYFGDGDMYDLYGDLYSGDGQTTIPLGADPNSTFYTVTDSVTYLTPGTFTASVSGGVFSQDLYYDGPYGDTWYYSSAALSASTQIHVNNVDPTITQINWSPVVTLGQNFGFSVDVSDPGLAGGERMSYAYDFSGTGTYTTLVSNGGASDSETYQFNTPGLHTVGIKVTDSNGGVTYGSFNVDVDPAAPEPSSLALFGMATTGLFGYSLRTRRRRVAAA